MGYILRVLPNSNVAKSDALQRETITQHCFYQLAEDIIRNFNVVDLECLQLKLG